MAQPVAVKVPPTSASIERTIGLKLLAREIVHEHHPGHMGVTWVAGGNRVFRGFRFKPTDLPEDFRPASRWRSYLIENTVPGYITNDIMLQDFFAKMPEKLLCLQWAAQPQQTEQIASIGEPRALGRYSFSPDQHTNCHNCVTWAIDTINTVLGQILPPIRTGRIKLAAKMLLEAGAQPPI